MRWALLPLAVALLYLLGKASAVRLLYDGAVVQGRSFRQRFFAADATSVVDFQLTTSKDSKQSGILEIAVVNGADLMKFPGPTRLHPGVLSFCCSEEFIQAGLCKTPGSLIIPKTMKTILHQLVPFGSDFRAKISLTSEGPHALLLSNCGFNSTVVSGHTEITSVRGHLPLHLYNLLAFYWFAANFFAILVIVVLMILIFVRKEFQLLHAFSLISILMAALEFWLWLKSLNHYNESGVYESSLQLTSIALAFIRRGLNYFSFAVVLFGYGLSSKFKISDLSVIDKKRLILYMGAFNFTQIFTFWYFSQDSFVQAYELSPFFIPLFIDEVLLAFLMQPAFKTKALLSGTRPRTHLFTVFNVLFTFLVVKLSLLTILLCISINFAENRGSIRHFRSSFLFPEASLQLSNIIIGIVVTLFVHPLGAYLVRWTQSQRRLTNASRERNDGNADELVPLGFNS